MIKRMKMIKQMKSMYSGVSLTTFESIFKNMLLLILIPVCVAIIIGLSSLYIVQKEIQVTSELIFESIQKEVDQNFNISLNLSNRIKKDMLISDYAKETNRNYYSEYEIMKKLQNLISGFEQVELVYAYYPQLNLIISNNNTSEVRNFYSKNYRGDYEEWANKLCIKQNTGIAIMDRIKDGYSCDVISKVLNIRTDSPQSVVVIQLKEKCFKDILKSMRLSDTDQVLVFHKDFCIGNTFSDKIDQEDLSKIKDSAVNHQTYKIDGVMYKIQKLSSPQYGLSFYYLTPNSIVHNTILFSEIYALLALILCIGITVSLSFVFSKRMDLSFHQVKNQNDQLLLTVKQYSNELKETYLEKIMLGHAASVQGIQEGCRLYGIEVKDRWFGLILINMINDEKENYERLSTDTVKYFKELIKENITNSRTDFEDASVIKIEERYYCIISVKADHAFSYQKELQECAVNIKNSLIEEKFYCTVYVSDSFKEIHNLYEAYKSVARQQQIIEEEDEVRESDNCSVDKILTIIKKRISDCNLSVADIAENIDVTTSYLSRFFKKQTGIGILEYIHQYRITMSKEIIMKNKNITIKKIAEMVGFNSDVVFIRVFKKSEGITPGQYREYLDGQNLNMKEQN